MTGFSCPVAITGSSVITSAGNGLEPLLDALKNQKCCLKPVPDELSDIAAGQFWGRAEHFRATDFIPPLKARKFDRGSQFAVAVAGLAMADAAIAKESIASDRIGIALGCGFGGIANSAEFLTGYFKQGVAGLAPMLFPNTVANAPASNSSIEYGIKGPNITFVQRFCSAESAVLAACRFIEEGRVDVMLAGGVDELTPLMMQGFSALGQLKTHASGFGEGSGILVLERGDHAVARGVRIKAWIEGVATIGRLFPGSEQSGIKRLIPVPHNFSHVVVSGAEQAAKPLLESVKPATIHYPGRFIGRSLAMGGISLAALTEILNPLEQGLHLAASPEGPYFALSLKGGDPA